MLLQKTFNLMIIFALLFNGGLIPTFLVVKYFGMVDTIWSMVLPALISIWNLIIMRTFFTAFP